MITVFYDGSCSVCSKEIAYYRRIADEKKFRWLDISRSPEALAHYNISYEDAMRLFHVIDHQQTLKIAVSGFMVIWSELRGWSVLAQIIRLPVIFSLANWCYLIFANWRYRRSTSCRVK